MAKKLRYPKSGTMINTEENKLSKGARIAIGIILEIFSALWFYGLFWNIPHHYELHTYTMPIFICMVCLSILIGIILCWTGYGILKNRYPFNQQFKG